MYCAKRWKRRRRGQFQSNRFLDVILNAFYLFGERFDENCTFRFFICTLCSYLLWIIMNFKLELKQKRRKKRRKTNWFCHWVSGLWGAVTRISYYYINFALYCDNCFLIHCDYFFVVCCCSVQHANILHLKADNWVLSWKRNSKHAIDGKLIICARHNMYINWHKTPSKKSSHKWIY